MAKTFDELVEGVYEALKKFRLSDIGNLRPGDVVVSNTPVVIERVDKNRLEFEIEYYRKDGSVSHTIHVRYERDEALFCPHCGSRSVWVEDDPGDYYLGPCHTCVSCGAEFSLSLAEPQPSVDEQLAQRLKYLRQGA